MSFIKMSKHISKIRHLFYATYILVSSTKPSKVWKKPKYNSHKINVLFLIYILKCRYLLFDHPKANFGPLMWGQLHSPDTRYSTVLT